MRRHLVVTALATLLAVSLFAAPADAVPPIQPNPTSFEDIIPNSLTTDTIFVGASPTIAELTGDAFAGRLAMPALYHTGVRSWMVLEGGTAFIDFPDDNAGTVEFWARVVSSADDDTVITAFDDLGVAIGSDVTIIPGAGWQLVTLTGDIDSIEVVNFATNEMNGIDDFSFVPEPSAALMLLSGGVLLISLGRRRYAP
jgi:hypothetical protein